MGIHIPYIFPIKWGAKELPRVTQPNDSLEILDLFWIPWKPRSPLSPRKSERHRQTSLKLQHEARVRFQVCICCRSMLNFQR